MGEVPTYYINLAGRPDRRTFMEEQLRLLGLNASRVEAKTPDDLTDAQRNSYCDPTAAFSMTTRQYACNLSHRAAWVEFLRSGQDFALFLEDDAVLSSRLPKFLSAVNPGFADIIRVETWPQAVSAFDALIEPVFSDELVFRTCLWRDAGAAAYILSRRAAAVLAEDEGLNYRLVDGFLFDPYGQSRRRLSVRYLDPGLSVQLCHIEPRNDAAKTSIGSLDEDRAFNASRRRRTLRSRVRKQSRIWAEQVLPRAALWAKRTFRGRRTVRLAIPYLPK